MGSGKALGSIGKIIKKVDPLRGGDVILEGIGLPTLTGSGDKNILDMGQTAAEDAAKAQAAQALASANQQAEAAAAQAQAIRDQTSASQASAAQQQALLLQQQNDSAANSARNAALNAQQNAASASAAEAAAQDSTPSVTTASTTDAANTRKKYNASAVSGITKTGSIRL